jgi:hypothetical protein
MFRKLIPSKKRVVVYLTIFAALFAGKVIWACIFFPGGKAVLSGGDLKDIEARREYLVTHIERQLSPKDMPAQIGSQFQGEWALVTYSMTAMALANVANRFPETVQESSEVITKILTEVLKEDLRQFDTARWGRDAFEQLDNLDGHIGYLGHLNVILAACYYLSADDVCERRFKEVSQALGAALEKSSFLNAETYPGEIYIPDNAVVIGSLGLYNRAFPEQALPVVDRWFAYVKKHYLDSKTGVLVFSLNLDGTIDQQSRGSGAAWSLFYLSYANKGFALDQYAALKKHFRSKLFWGITGIREWADGRWSLGDVDSGPVLLRLSPSGSGFSIAGAVLAEDARFLGELLFTAEFVGSTVQSKAGRRYLLAPLVGDAILLAMRTVVAWKLPEGKRSSVPHGLKH